jgi:hypothetical protein
MNLDHISENLETTFRFKILKFFNADPGSGMEKIRIRDKHPGSATLGKSGTFTNKDKATVAKCLGCLGPESGFESSSHSKYEERDNRHQSTSAFFGLLHLRGGGGRGEGVGG